MQDTDESPKEEKSNGASLRMLTSQLSYLFIAGGQRMITDIELSCLLPLRESFIHSNVN